MVNYACALSQSELGKYFEWIIINNYSLKSRWIVAEYLRSRFAARLTFLKPLFTEIEKNNCFSIYPRSDLNKIREETIKKYDLIDGSRESLQNFQTWQFTSLWLRKQQRNGLNGTVKTLNCFLTWEEKKSSVVFCWLAKFMAKKVCCVVLRMKCWQKWRLGCSR